MIKKTARVIIVANGVLYEGIVDRIQKNDIVIGVDRAAYWLIRHGKIPDGAIGDFDSCTPQELAVIKKHVKHIQSFSPEKNFTDTELALREALKRNPREIIIFGGLGNRMDHSLAVISLLAWSLKTKTAISMEDETNCMMLLWRGRTILNKREGYRYVSIIPYTNSIQITLSGFKYTLDKKIIARGQTIGISNEFLDRQAEIMLHRGSAFIIQSSD
jgi:thiamine pyrophosphokinase